MSDFAAWMIDLVIVLVAGVAALVYEWSDRTYW